MTTKITISKTLDYTVRVSVQDELVDGSWQDRPSETVILKEPGSSTEKTIWKKRGRRLIIEEIE